MNPINRSKLIFLLIAFGLLVSGSSARASGMTAEVRPEIVDAFPLLFDIRSVRLANGEIQFTITVSERPPGAGSNFPRYLKVPEKHTTFLATIEIPLGRSATEGKTKMIRAVSSDRHGNVITSTFSITENDLLNPDLCFFLEFEGCDDFPGGDFYFIRLKKNWKPK